MQQHKEPNQIKDTKKKRKKTEQNLFFAQNKYQDLFYRLFQREIFFLQFCGGGREESQNSARESEHETSNTIEKEDLHFSMK
jgi:hypothetical protein